MKIVVSHQIEAMKRTPYPRSLGRSRRRAAQGHPQHYRMTPATEGFLIGDTLYVTPAQYELLKRKFPPALQSDAARSFGVFR